MSLLTIVRDAWSRLGIGTDLPSVVMANSDAQVAILRALATQEGRELAARVAWQRLTKEASFTTVAQEAQTGAIPADFGRLIPETVWNYTEREPLIGPVSAAEWQALQAGLVGPPDLHYRIRGNDFLIIPTPPAGETVKYEYVSAYWVDTDGDGDGGADAWASDTDTALLSEELLTLGVVWRWLKRNRSDYAAELAEYTTQVSQAIARDGGRGILGLGGRRYGDGPRQPGVPDGSWSL